MVRVKLFAWFREKAGVAEVELSLGRGARVRDVVEELKRRYPGLEEAFRGGNFFVSVNHEVAELEQELGEEDEVAFFPPVSGG
ncbi:MAG: molybdopterin converting factor subunit 1 [Euryarchaeota archaeon]|nr:molybdopterin converting factor subunit 1 [Euryarchaeota archaeon]